MGSTTAAALRTNEREFVQSTLPKAHTGMRSAASSGSSSATIRDSLLELVVVVVHRSSDAEIAIRQTKSTDQILHSRPDSERLTIP